MINKSIWLTGSRGFIGKHLVQGLKKNNIDIKCFSNNLSLNKIEKNVEQNLFYMDFSSRENINKQIEKFGCPDIFIHLGWGDMESPMSTRHLTDNVNEAEILIDSFYSAGIEKFIFIGSMNEYGARLGSLSEDMKPKGRLTNYAKGKIQVADYGYNRSKFYNKIFIHIRPFYVFGPGQRKGSLINELFDANLNKRHAKLGPCDHYRDYIYVSDVTEGIVRLSKIEETNTINLGSGSFIQVKDYVILFWKYLGGDLDKLKFGSRKMSKDEPEQPKSYANLSKLKELTNWHPSYSIEYGIKTTIECLNQSCDN